MSSTFISVVFQFPSPFGVRVLKFSKAKRQSLHRAGQFPSPFGVRVLKLGGERLEERERPRFRPLSGFVF